MALSPQGRVSFPNVFHASAMEGSDRKTFSNTLLINVNELSRDPNPNNADGVSDRQLFDDMVNAANEAAIKRFGVGLGEEYPEDSGETLRSPFRKSETKKKHYPNHPGHIFVKFTSESKPGVVDEARDEISESSGNYYAGCWAHNSWTVYAYDKGGNRGVGFGLKNTQKTGDDDAFGAGRTSPDDDFEVLDRGQQSTVAASSSASDDIPF